MSARVAMPRFVWIAVALELFTAVLAIPIGLQFITDPSGGSLGVPASWLDRLPFHDYLIPGLYLFTMNGLGMLALAVLTVIRHPVAPWFTGALGIGLMIWISVQVIFMPEIMILQPLFFAVGLAMGFIALFWLIRTDWTGLRRAS